MFEMESAYLSRRMCDARVIVYDQRSANSGNKEISTIDVQKDRPDLPASRIADNLPGAYHGKCSRARQNDFEEGICERLELSLCICRTCDCSYAGTVGRCQDRLRSERQLFSV